MSATGTNTSIGQLHHQSVTAPSRATHAVDTVGAHRCHELWSHTRVAEWQTVAPDIWPPNSPDLNPVDYAIWSVIQLDAVGNILRVQYKSVKCECDVSFSVGSISTLFRWGGHFCHVYVCKTFLPAYNNAKIIKIDQDFPELWSQMYCHLFMVHSVHATRTVNTEWVNKKF